MKQFDVFETRDAIMDAVNMHYWGFRGIIPAAEITDSFFAHPRMRCNMQCCCAGPGSVRADRDPGPAAQDYVSPRAATRSIRGCAKTKTMNDLRRWYYPATRTSA